MAEKSKRSIGAWFREMRSELKKVVWPSGKEVYKNTLVVLIVCAIFAIITYAMDALLNAGVLALLGL